MVTDVRTDRSYRRNAVGGFDDEWHYGYLYTRALTVGGGTGEVQLSIVPERVFGPARDPDSNPALRGLDYTHGRFRVDTPAANRYGALKHFLLKELQMLIACASQFSGRRC